MSFVEATDGSSEPLAREGPAEEEHEDAPPAPEVDEQICAERFENGNQVIVVPQGRTFTWPAEAFNS